MIAFPEYTEALSTDSEQRSLQKIVQLMNDNPGGGGGGGGIATHFGAATDPNGAVVGSVGDLYKSSEGSGGDGTLWVKRTGSGTNTGWE